MSTGLGDAMVIGAGEASSGATASSRSWTSRSWGARWAAPSARSSPAPASGRPSDACPLVCVTASGGARMQEGILSLMQLPKTVMRRRGRCASALCRVPRRDDPPDDGRRAGELREPGRRDPSPSRARCSRSPGPASSSRPCARSCPTTSASTESNFRFGHLDRDRVARSTCGRCSAGCWRSSPMAADEQRSPRQVLTEQLRLRERLCEAERASRRSRGAGVSGELERLKRQIDRIEDEPRRPTRSGTSSARAPRQERPYTLDYVERIFDDFVELHGDRCNADDEALVTGLGRFRRPHGGARRAPEGARHPRADAPQLRDGVP